MNSQWSYAHFLEVNVRDQYDDGASKLPDPYFMQDGWQNNPSQCQ